MLMNYPNVQLVRVIDGDTAHLNVDLGFNTWRLGEPYRFAGINAPELSTPEGQAAKTALLAFLAGGTGRYQIDSHGKDKYGRWLITLFSEQPQVGFLPRYMNVNEWMLANGFAVKMTTEVATK